MSRQCAINVTTIYDIFCPVPFLPSPFGFRRFKEVTVGLQGKTLPRVFWRACKIRYRCITRVTDPTLNAPLTSHESCIWEPDPSPCQPSRANVPTSGSFARGRCRRGRSEIPHFCSKLLLFALVLWEKKRQAKKNGKKKSEKKSEKNA